MVFFEGVTVAVGAIVGVMVGVAVIVAVGTIVAVTVGGKGVSVRFKKGKGDCP
jgi:hypothetical protein